MRLFTLIGAAALAGLVAASAPASAQPVDGGMTHHRMHRMMHHDRMMMRHDRRMMRHDRRMMRHHMMHRRMHTM